MANLFSRHNINRFVLATILTSFSLAYSTPLPAQQFNIGFNEVALMVRLEKLVEKLINSKDKGIDKMIEYVVDIKGEIEAATNTSIDLNKCMDMVTAEINKTGQKAPKKEMEAIKKKLKDREKKNKKHAKYLAATMYVEGYEFNEHDEELMFPTYMAKKSHGDKDKDKEDKEEIIPFIKNKV